jgi:hypothetical protein
VRAGEKVDVAGYTYEIWSPGPRSGRWWATRYDTAGRVVSALIARKGGRWAVEQSFAGGAPTPAPHPDHAHTDPCVFCATRDGAGARDAGIKATARRDLEWWKRAERWIDGHFDGQTFTADDLTAALDLPEGSPNAVGAFLRTQRLFGVIEAAGFTTATRPSSHGRTLRVWRVVGSAERP